MENSFHFQGNFSILYSKGFPKQAYSSVVSLSGLALHFILENFWNIHRIPNESLELRLCLNHKVCLRVAQQSARFCISLSKRSENTQSRCCPIKRSKKKAYLFQRRRQHKYWQWLGWGWLEGVPSFKCRACSRKDTSGEAHMSLIGTREEKFHFAVNAVVSQGTARKRLLVCQQSWNGAPVLCDALRNKNPLRCITATRAES